MQLTDIGGLRLNCRIDGPDDGTPVVFANSLGTDMRMWDPIMPHLPAGLRILRYDKRGHGLSDAPEGAYSMGNLVTDVEKLMVAHGFKDAVFVGLSIGGLIAQGLAAKRLDLVRALVLSNTGAKIGNRDLWADRIKVIEEGGLEAAVDATMDRWFPPKYQKTDAFQSWKRMHLTTPAHGWTGCAAAIAGADFLTPTSALRLPALGIAGSEDKATPPDLVREAVDLIPGSQFALIRGAGHLPCIQNPKEYAQILTGFLKSQGAV